MSIENLMTQNYAKTVPGYQIMDNGLVLIHRKQPKPGLVRISRSNIARKLENAFSGTSEEPLNPFEFGKKDIQEEKKKKKNKKNKKTKKRKGKECSAVFRATGYQQSKAKQWYDLVQNTG